MQNTVPYVETDSYCIISFAMSTYGSYCAISRPMTIGIWLMQANSFICRRRVHIAQYGFIYQNVTLNFAISFPKSTRGTCYPVSFCMIQNWNPQ